MVVKTESILKDISEIVPPWENPLVVYEIPDSPYTIQKCDTEWDYGIEGYFLAHCLGTKDFDHFSRAHAVYSLRDAAGIPHATILCVREDEYSPYGMCWDIGGVEWFTPEDPSEKLRILQVRGRNDDIAHPVFHSMVRGWYVNFGGRILVDIEKLVNLLMRKGDHDFEYHFEYLLDESTNQFGWAHWNEKMRAMAALAGTSL